MHSLVVELERHLDDTESPDPRALASIALCVGGLSIAQAMGDAPLAEKMLEACRNAAQEQLSRRD